MDPIESVFLQLASLLYIELIWEREGDTDTVINVRWGEGERASRHYHYIIIINDILSLIKMENSPTFHFWQNLARLATFKKS